MKFAIFKTINEGAQIAIRVDTITSIYEESENTTCITFANDETMIVNEPLCCVLAKISKENKQ